jgi:hypothetical protein
MNRTIAQVTIAFAAMIVAGLLAGRWLTILVDRAMPVSPLKYDGGGFRIGNLPLTFVGTDNLRSDLKLTVDSLNRAILQTRDRTFILGPTIRSGNPDLEFSADPDDRVSLSSRRNFGWPAYELRILGGPSPWWKRDVYYKLRWHKSTGASLEMHWRYQQQYYRSTGWTQPAMMWNSQTGLLAAEISDRSRPRISHFQ